MSIIYFDIETQALPREELDALAPEFKPAANLKDPDKIKASVEEKRNSYYDEAALSPITGSVLAVGFEEDCEFKMLDGNGDERSLLKEVWKIRDQDIEAVWAGFNIAAFDLPFLIRRSMKHGIRVPWVYDKFRKLGPNFIDLMHVWQCTTYGETISLDRLAKFLGVGQKNGDGKDFAALFRTDRAKALDYLKNDLELTRKCAERMGVA